MPAARQLSFLPKPSKSHGGDTRVGKRKIARPLDPKRPVHLTLRASRARGQWSMLRRANERAVKKILLESSQANGVKVLRFANVGNHLHLIVRFRAKQDFQRFLKHFSGRVAAAITGSIKGNPLEGRFWDHLAHTRILEWGRDLMRAGDYVILNLFEAAGLAPKDQKGKRVKGLRMVSMKEPLEMARGPGG